MMGCRLSVSMPHAALWVVQHGSRACDGLAGHGFNAARGFVGGAAKVRGFGRGLLNEVSMPHAALWVVQPYNKRKPPKKLVFQCRTRLCGWCSTGNAFPVYRLDIVSMPHAALWVVQLRRSQLLSP